MSRSAQEVAGDGCAAPERSGPLTTRALHADLERPAGGQVEADTRLFVTSAAHEREDRTVRPEGGVMVIDVGRHGDRLDIGGGENR
jgi:hypothetical protein